MAEPIAEGAGSDSAVPPRWTHSWRDLSEQVLDQGLCTGCSGCIIVCPRNVLTLDPETWRPQLSSEAWANGDPQSCAFTERGCTMCTRACPRFGTWETDADMTVRGRTRTADEILGVYQEILLVNAVDPQIADAGQDGGLATAMLTFALENDVIDAALVSYFDEGQSVRPGVARNRAELLQAAGSRYTYSPTTLALAEAVEFNRQDRLGMVSVGCQVSIPAVAGERGARRLARRFALTIGLLCSVTFDESIYTDLILEDYGIERHDIRKVNIKGRLQIWTDSPFDDPPDLEIALKECGPYRRAGCSHCPDFTAQHADISLGGIGSHPATTLTIVRTDLAADLLRQMEAAGWITIRDAAEHDPAAVALITKMALRQRKRWNTATGAAETHPEPGLLPDPTR